MDILNRSLMGALVLICAASFIIGRETKCEKQRKHALYNPEHMVGVFVPQCDADGAYSKEQCYGSTGHCWCVNKDGTMINGTDTRPGTQQQRNLNCSKDPTTTSRSTTITTATPTPRIIPTNAAELNEAVRVDFYSLEAAGKLTAIPANILKDVRSELILANKSETFAWGRRPGRASEDHRCGRITGLPRKINFVNKRFYRKYTHAYGIPVLSSGRVTDQALKVACYIVRILFADRADVRRYFYSHFGRVAVIGEREHTTTIPEFSNLPNWWNQRARGLGGMLSNPISTGGEENLLCHPRGRDRYTGQDIFLHEASHSVAEVSIRAGAVPGFYQKLQRHYNYCRRSGRLWRGTYAMSTVRELFAHGTQSYFDCNFLANPPNGIHNHVNTRAKLRTYDITLYNLLKEVYPCRNKYYWCHDYRKGPPPDPKMNCRPDGTSKTKTKNKRPQPKPKPKPQPKPSDCKDIDPDCSGWGQYCKDPEYVDYMKKNCKKKCKVCGESSCEDKNKDCAYWAKNNYCGSDYMDKNCRKSCKKC